MTVFATPDSSRIQRIFTSITPRYDLLNSILSFGLDSLWRNWAVKNTLRGNEKDILDIGTGTGRFLRAFVKKQNFEKACGLDLCESMLQKARAENPAAISWLAANAAVGLPFQKSSFDLVTSAFTLRSIRDLKDFFSEVYRVMKPGGHFSFLELTRPRSKFLQALYAPYLKLYLPAVGAAFTRSEEAYQFLSQSIMNFKTPEELGELITSIGFERVRVRSFSGGIATLLSGEKHAS